MAEIPAVVVDLTQEPLELSICGACWALTRKDDFARHQQWHAAQAQQMSAQAPNQAKGYWSPS